MLLIKDHFLFTVQPYNLKKKFVLISFLMTIGFTLNWHLIAIIQFRLKSYEHCSYTYIGLHCTVYTVWIHVNKNIHPNVVKEKVLMCLEKTRTGLRENVLKNPILYNVYNVIHLERGSVSSTFRLLIFFYFHPPALSLNPLNDHWDLKNFL